MNAIKKVLYPTDFSEFSASTLAHAAYICERYGAELHVVHATQPAEAGSAEASVYAPLEETEWSAPFKQYVASLDRDRLRVKAIIAAEVALDAVSDVVLEYAKQHEVDLIVMGTHGRRGLGRLFLGSTAEDVVRLAPCPVVTVGGKARRVLGAGIRRILVPVDFSKSSMKGLDTAKDLAARFGAKMDLLHVIEPIAVPVPYGITFPAVTTPEVFASTKKALEDMKAGINGIEVATYVEHGVPENTIASYAEKKESDLIVMASHGLSGLDRFVHGSVSQEVMRLAPCPVYTVKSRV